MTAYERRLRVEWEQLRELAQLNPGRLTDLSAEDRTFLFTLLATPTRLVNGKTSSVHYMRVVFPQFYPSVPMEMYVQKPFFHANVHPESGFVCLWAQHRVNWTIEHAVHKVVAMMAGKLYNRETLHVMQPQALALLESRGTGNDREGAVIVKPLHGIAHNTLALELPLEERDRPKRARLS